MTRLTGLIGVSLVLAMLGPSLTASSERFVVGIVRRDGGIVPFAAYESGRWQRAWPGADETSATTRSIDQVASVWRRRGEKVPRLWNVWPASGTSPRTTAVTGIAVVDAHCQRQVVLATDWPSATGDPHIKAGVAIDSDTPLNSVERVTESDAVWASAARTVVAHFASSEAAEASRKNQTLPQEKSAPIVRIRALYREANDGDSPLYFVSEKRYRTTQGAAACGSVTLMTGWLVPTASLNFSVRGKKVFLTDCDGKTVRTALPLAAIHFANRRFWVIQEHGYEDETYVLVEIAKTGIQYLVEAEGGGC